jgi:hypothetical protein
MWAYLAAAKPPSNADRKLQYLVILRGTNRSVLTDRDLGGLYQGIDRRSFSQVHLLGRVGRDDRDDLNPAGEGDRHLAVHGAFLDQFDSTFQLVSRTHFHRIADVNRLDTDIITL